MIVSITGFMGAGKSIVAKELSKRVNLQMVDLDHYIESKEGGVSVSELFSTRGERVFRELEEKALAELIEERGEHSFILSLGGGTLLSPKSRELIKNNTFCIYLIASIETIASRIERSFVKRPLLTDSNNQFATNRLQTLFLEREFGYNYASHMVIRVDSLTVNEIVEKIEHRLSIE
ncbi:MAG: shikimate kinase [Bacteroidales bacterium]